MHTTFTNSSSVISVTDYWVEPTIFVALSLIRQSDDLNFRCLTCGTKRFESESAQFLCCGNSIHNESSWIKLCVILRHRPAHCTCNCQTEIFINLDFSGGLRVSPYAIQSKEILEKIPIMPLDLQIELYLHTPFMGP
jgi:hypothetical protein